MVPLSDAQAHHLHRVLRLESGGLVDYTDGAGRLGSGRMTERGIERGDEWVDAESKPSLCVAVAPPHARERVRFLVEKLSEMGVARIRWLRTHHGEGRPPRGDRSAAWATAALEQSRGAWQTRVDDDWCGWGDLDDPVVVAHSGGESLAPGPAVTLAVGPEGGWGDAEVPEGLARLSLGSRILRVETAAIVGAARLLS